MQTLEKVLLQTAVGAWALAAWLLLCDASLIPQRFLLSGVNGVVFHWQIFLVVGAVLLASRDQVTDLRCRCCGNHEDLSWRALLKFREILCRSCMAWDPKIQTKPAASVSPEYADLFEALKQ